MYKVVKVEPRADFKLWLAFDDGTCGEADLSDLVGKGVFKRFLDNSYFRLVQIGPFGDIHWPGEVDMSPDSLYLRVTGHKPEEVFPSLRSSGVHTDA